MATLERFQGKQFDPEISRKDVYAVNSYDVAFRRLSLPSICGAFQVVPLFTLWQFVRSSVLSQYIRNLHNVVYNKWRFSVKRTVKRTRFLHDCIDFFFQQNNGHKSQAVHLPQI